MPVNKKKPHNTLAFDFLFHFSAFSLYFSARVCILLVNSAALSFRCPLSTFAPFASLCLSALQTWTPSCP